jgi:nitrate reductase beta subunit
MIEYSAHEYAAGNLEEATGVLKRTQEFTHKIRSLMAGNSKKLKDTQILLRRTAFRMTELLHTSSYEDRSLIQQTLAQLNQTQDDLMMQVFEK